MDQSSSFFVQSELEVLAFWDRAKIFEQSVEKTAPHGDYRFYDGPPFATGTPHYGHIVASIIKDVVPRFWTMKGYRVERRWGWDCHGLPIENIVEKELGYRHKKDIEALGIDKFNELCRSRVLSYVDEWQTIIHRLGRFVDMDNAYLTMDLSFMESVWWVFKELWDRGLIYQGYRSMYICPRCETTLSQSEVAEGYKDIKDLSCTVKFPLLPGEKIGRIVLNEPTYLVAWTTTPWTLIANVALAVGADMDYIMVEIPANFDFKQFNVDLDLAAGGYIFSVDCAAKNHELHQLLSLARQGHVKSREFQGRDLVGLKYVPPFDFYYSQSDLVNKDKGWQVYPADFINTEDGTGIVHIAPGFGEDDWQLAKQYNLPFVQHVKMDGTIKEEAIGWAGLNVKPAEDYRATDVKIVEYLHKNGLLFSQEEYEHSYPHCWRCDTPLINYATSSWFVNVTKIKPLMLKEAKKINWSPSYIKEGRFGQWLEGAKDWSISRQRYWASVIPIWQCSCGWQQVIGSVQELAELSGAEITDLHKHIVDKITIKCPNCGKLAHRVPDVLDTWFDSGSMPYAQAHYPFENAQDFDSHFPAQFIAEGIDQTRCWFYYLQVISTALGRGVAFRNVIVNGIVLAEDGKKMSKKLQNYPDPAELLDRYGADALRYYLLASPVTQAENLNFSETGVEEAIKKITLPVWNVYKFYDLYGGNERSVLSRANWHSDNILDHWIVSRLYQLLGEIDEAMMGYNLPRAVRPLAVFVDDLSGWYLRRSRSRFKNGESQDKDWAVITTNYVLQHLSLALAPFTPFLAEALWQKITGFDYKYDDKSVHLLSWPTDLSVDEEVLAEMAAVREIAELALAQRDAAGLKIRQVLSSLTVKGPSDRLSLISSAGLDILADELNVKHIITEAHNIVNWEVSLDTTLTPELMREGLARELVRHINLLRKESGLSLSDQTIIYWRATSPLAKLTLDELAGTITKETLSGKIVEGRPDQFLAHKTLNLDDGILEIMIAKLN